MESQFDVLVVLHVITAPSDGSSSTDPDNKMSYDDTGADGFGQEGARILEVCWCAFDLSQHIVIDERQLYVRPSDGFVLSKTIQVECGLTQEKIMGNGTSLKEVINQFNDSCYTNYTKENKSFCLAVMGDDFLTRMLPTEIKDLHLKLPQHFYQYFDILHEFKKFYPQTNQVSTIPDLLTYLSLRDLKYESRCQSNTKNLVRVLNKLAKDNHKFMSPKILDHKFKVISGMSDTTGGYSKNNYKKWSAYIHGRAPEPFKNPSKDFVLRLRGLPYVARESEVLEFLRGLRVKKDVLAFLYDHEGKFTGEAFVKLLNESDYKEGMSFHMGQMGNRYIEIYESTSDDFMKAFNSQFPDKRDVYFNASDLDIALPKDTGILKMKGLPLSATEEDIKLFFQPNQISENGVKRSIISGKPSGEAFVLFPTQELAQQAILMNMEKIGNRYIELTETCLKEYENFMNHNFINCGPAYSRDRMPNIPLEKRKNTLLVSGLPFDTNKEELKLFFKAFNVIEDDIHLITNHGKFSGTSLVSFDDEMEAQKALKTKNLAYIRNRYVELYEYR